jgi:hypothetical protein
LGNKGRGVLTMSNYDEKTGIHFGVISPNSICQETLQDLCFGSNSIDPHYEAGKQEIIDDLKQFCEDHYLNFEDIDPDQFIDQFSDRYENSDGQYDYEDIDYTLHISGDNFGIFVIRSPYYTFTRQCSPCAPGAGDLNTPAKIDKRFTDRSDPGFTNGVQTYCLPVEFFDEYAKIPYRYYRVDNDKEVIAPIVEVN